MEVEGAVPSNVGGAFTVPIPRRVRALRVRQECDVLELADGSRGAAEPLRDGLTKPCVSRATQGETGLADACRKASDVHEA